MFWGNRTLATVGESLAISYARARAVSPGLRKGQFMQRVFQGRYKNEASAYQAYNQTVKERRSGARLGKLSTEAQPPLREGTVLKKNKGKRFPKPQQAEAGLWKINVTFVYINQDGKTYEDTRSFVARSDQYQTLMDIPYIEEIILASVDNYIAAWIENNSMQGNYIDKSIEVIPIYNTNLPSEQVLEIDEIEEGEDYDLYE